LFRFKKKKGQTRVIEGGRRWKGRERRVKFPLKGKGWRQQRGECVSCGLREGDVEN